jgi:hypothetical protein
MMISGLSEFSASAIQGVDGGGGWGGGGAFETRMTRREAKGTKGASRVSWLFVFQSPPLSLSAPVPEDGFRWAHLSNQAPATYRLKEAINLAASAIVVKR